MKFVSRGDTTVVDAYLSPILRRYVEQVAAEMPGVKLFFMRSSGGLDARPSRARTPSCPVPAGGIVGMVRTAQLAKNDLGGERASSVSTWAAPRPTSATTPASSSAPSRPRWPGAGARAHDEHPHRGTAAAPSSPSTGSAASGPESAGANPGPACYRPRRAVGRDRRQRDGRQDPAGLVPESVRRACDEP